MRTLALDSFAQAEARSRAEWEKRLGRKKRPEDVTEFLWQVEAAPDGKAALVIPASDETALTTTEARRLTTRVDAIIDGQIAVDETVRGG